MPDLDIGRLVGYIELDDSGVAAGAKSAKDKVNELGKSGAGLAKAAGIGMGLALAGGLVAAISTDAAGAKLAAGLDLSASESERYGELAGRLYSGAYGESLEEVNEALRNVTLNIAGMADASDADLERISGKVLDVSTAFDQDLGGVTRAVGTILRTGLARDADEALDVLTRGFQTGVNVADDLLDTFSEYSTQFRALGLDATDATGLMRQGLQGGARDADIVADALKELAIRSKDGSESTARGFDTLGLSGEEMGRKFAAGGASAREALDTTLDRLRNIDDPTLRAAAAVDLFGTQSEDLAGALDALDLDTAADEMGNVEGAAKRVGDLLGNTAAAQFTKLTRSAERFAVELAGGALPIVSELGGTVLDVLTPALEVVGTVVGGVAEAFGALPTPIATSAVAIGGLILLRGPIAGLGTSFAKLTKDAVVWGTYGVASALGGMSSLTTASATANASVGTLARRGVGGLSAALGGPLGLAIAGVTIAIPVLSSLFGDNAEDADRAARANSGLAEALRDSEGAIDDNVRAAAAKELEDRGLLETARRLGIDLGLVTDAILGNEDALEEVTKAANDYYDASLDAENAGDLGMTRNAEGAKDLLDGLGELAPTVAETAAEQARLAEATDDSAESTDGQAEASAAAAVSAEDQAEAFDRLKDAIDRYLGVNIDAAEAQLAVLDGLADLGEQTATNGTTLDRTTQAGRDNERAILDQITAIGDLATATYQQTGSSEEARAAFDREREALRNKLLALGYNKDEVNRLIETYGRIPDEVWTDVNANTTDAATKLDRLAEKLGTLTNGRHNVDVYVTESGGRRLGVGYSLNADGGLLEFYAGGGLRTLNPMSGARSARVAADTWRVIGDRPVGDEFYLLDDDQPSTLALGAEWAQRRGMGLVPLAAFRDGGKFPGGSGSAGLAVTGRGLELVVRIDGNVYGDAYLRRAIADAGDELLERLDDALANAGVHP